MPVELRLVEQGFQILKSHLKFRQKVSLAAILQAHPLIVSDLQEALGKALHHAVLRVGGEAGKVSYMNV
jgi:hypothetical protein